MPTFFLVPQAVKRSMMATHGGEGQLCVAELQHPGLGGPGMV